jgi:hypothetical protein
MRLVQGERNLAASQTQINDIFFPNNSPIHHNDIQEYDL